MQFRGMGVMAVQAKFTGPFALSPSKFPLTMRISVLRKSCGPVDLLAMTVHALPRGLDYDDGSADLLVALNMVS